MFAPRFGGCGGRLARRRAPAIPLTTTILGEIADQPVHRIEVSAIDELAADALLRNEPAAGSADGVNEDGRTDPLANGAGRQPFRTSLDEQAVNCQSMFVGSASRAAMTIGVFISIRYYE
jgi:hypothetical protein